MKTAEPGQMLRIKGEETWRAGCTESSSEELLFLSALGSSVRVTN